MKRDDQSRRVLKRKPLRQRRAKRPQVMQPIPVAGPFERWTGGALRYDVDAHTRWLQMTMQAIPMEAFARAVDEGPEGYADRLKRYGLPYLKQPCRLLSYERRGDPTPWFIGQDGARVPRIEDAALFPSVLAAETAWLTLPRDAGQHVNLVPAKDHWTV